MPVESRGIPSLYWLLLTSLLLHVAIVVAIGRFKPDRNRPQASVPPVQKGAGGDLLLAGKHVVMVDLTTGKVIDPGADAGARHEVTNRRGATNPSGSVSHAVPYRPGAAEVGDGPQIRKGIASAVSPGTLNGRQADAAAGVAQVGGAASGKSLSTGAGVALKVAGSSGAVRGGTQPAQAGAGGDTKKGFGLPTASGGAGTAAVASLPAAGAVRRPGAIAGSLAGDEARRSSYQARIKALIEAHKKYPVAARKSGREGSCQRRFVLARDGSLQGVERVSSCGHPFLDAAATEAITGVGRFPSLPEEFRGTEESFTVNIAFSLSNR